MLPKQAIKEFREIYKREFGVRLSNDEATEKVISLLGLFKVLLKSHTSRQNLKLTDK